MESGLSSQETLHEAEKSATKTLFHSQKKVLIEASGKRSNWSIAASFFTGWEPKEKKSDQKIGQIVACDADERGLTAKL